MVPPDIPLEVQNCPELLRQHHSSRKSVQALIKHFRQCEFFTRVPLSPRHSFMSPLGLLFVFSADLNVPPRQICSCLIL
eukprot:4904743-Amphidinium_carterae.1